MKNFRITYKIAWAVFLSLYGLLQNIVLRMSIPVTNADWIQDNPNGYTETNFMNNLAGISSGVNYSHNPSSPGTISQDGGSDGYVITSNSIPPSNSGWTTYTIDYSGTPPDYEIRDCSGNVLSSSTYSAPVSLLGAPYETQKCLKSKVILKPGTTIDNVRFTWKPLPVAMLQIIGPSQLTAGQCYDYKVSWSLSYFDDGGLVLYVQLPQSLRGLSNTGGYGFPSYQWPSYDPVFSGSSNGGTYTATSTVINGNTVPAHSVYRNIGPSDLGSTHVYRYTLCTTLGTQDEVLMNFDGSIVNNDGKVLSDTLDTLIVSAPIAEQLAYHGPNMINSGAINKVVTYNFDHSNGFYNQTASEDIFNPTTTLDFTDMFNDMTTQCSISTLADKQARVQMIYPTGGWTRNGNTLSTTHQNLLNPMEQLTGMFTVDLSGCIASANVFNVNVLFSGTNISTLTKTLGTTIYASAGGSDGAPGGCNPMSLSLNYHIGGTYNSSVSTTVSAYPGSLVILGAGGANKGLMYNHQSTFVKYNVVEFYQAPLDRFDILPGGMDIAYWNDHQAPIPFPLFGQGIFSPGYLPNNTIYCFARGNTIRDLHGAYPGVLSSRAVNPSKICTEMDYYDDFTQYYYYYSPTLLSSPPAVETGNMSLTGAYLPTTLGSGWSTTIPTGTGGYVWIAGYSKCINTSTNPAPPGSTCHKRPMAIYPGFHLRVKDTMACGTTTPGRSTTPFAKVYSKSVTLNNDDSAAIWLNPTADNGTYSWNSCGVAGVSTILPKVSTLPFTTSKQYFTGNNTYACDTDPNTYMMNINAGSDTLSNVVIRVTLPTTNGVLPTVSNISAGGSQVGNQIVWNFASIPANSDIQPTFDLLRDKANYTHNTVVVLTGTMSANGACNTVSANLSKSVTLTCNSSFPELQTFKYLDKTLIIESGSINYAISTTNISSVASTYTFVVDRIPSATVFNQLYLSGVIPTMTGLTDTNYSCIGCKVFFSDDATLPLITPTNLYSFDSYDPGRTSVTVGANGSTYTFNAGSCNGAGVCTSPYGTATKGVLILHDNTDLIIPTFNPGLKHTVGIKVTNESNVRGDIITNIVGTFAFDLLQAISNQVETTLLPYIPNSIAGIVYHDADFSSGYMTGEGLFSGVLISLYSGTTLVKTGLTNISGAYYFGNLSDGVYKVIYDVSTVPGYEAFVSNTGNVGGTSRGMTMGLTGLAGINLAGGEDSIQNNFGLVQSITCTINGYVYIDNNMNNEYDTGTDTIIVGQTIMLSNGDIAVTNGSGYYEFSGLNCSANYTVNYTGTITGYLHDSAQFEQTTQQPTSTGISVPNSTFDIDIDDLISPNNNFGLVPETCSINGYVYVDNNINNEYDAGTDTILVGQTVMLSDGKIVLTNGSGYYEFTGLDCSAGYRVSYPTAATGYVHDSAQFEQTTQQPTDVEIEVATGTFDVDTLDLVSPDNNFGLVPEQCAINGYVYVDNNNNGLYDTGDTILGGQTIMLSNGDIAVTNDMGYYEFSGLDCSANYTVSFTQENTGYNHSSAQYEYSTQQSTSTGISVPNTSFDILVLDTISPNNNFALTTIPCHVNGFIYVDTDHDDQYTFGVDMPLSGLSVYLDGTGAMSITNDLGYYEFIDVSCGEHIITYDNNTIYIPDSAQFEQSTQQPMPVQINIPDSALDPIILDTISPNNNFGLEAYSCEVNGYVYVDTDTDKLFTPGVDTPISFVTVLLDGGNKTTTTNSSGYYVFTGIGCGPHQIRYNNPISYLFPDSAQFEQTTQQPTPDLITILNNTFNITTDDIISPTNNFGLIVKKNDTTPGGTYIFMPLPTPFKIIATLEQIVSHVKKSKMVQIIDSVVDEVSDFVMPDALPETGADE